MHTEAKYKLTKAQTSQVIWKQNAIKTKLEQEKYKHGIINGNKIQRQ